MQGLTGNEGGMDSGVDNMLSAGMLDWGDRGINSVLDPMNINGMLQAGRNDILGMYGAGMQSGEQGYGRAVGAMTNAMGQATGNYNTAQGYLNPYAQGGQTAFNQWGANAANMGNSLNQQPNMGQYQWQQAQQSPQQYYQNIMGGYQMSPQAQYAQQVATRAGNSAAAASGMMGSGAYMNGMQRNANDISQQDQQQYFNNVMGSNNAQMGQLQNYQGQQGMYNNMLQNQAGMGYGATGQQAQNAMNLGQWNFNAGQNIGNWATNNAAGQMQLAGQTGGNLAQADKGMMGDLGGIASAVASFI